MTNQSRQCCNLTHVVRAIVSESFNKIPQWSMAIESSPTWCIRKWYLGWVCKTNGCAFYPLIHCIYELHNSHLLERNFLSPKIPFGFCEISFPHPTRPLIVLTIQTIPPWWWILCISSKDLFQRFILAKAHAIPYKWELHLESYMAKEDNVFIVFESIFLSHLFWNMIS